MAVEINIASAPCCICKTPLQNCKGFADTKIVPFDRFNGAWGYVCEDHCFDHISPVYATRFDVVKENGFAIGRKRRLTKGRV
jgi:hypothetical protein